VSSDYETVSVSLAVYLPRYVAVIVAVPAATAVTRPVEETVATSSSLD
jgi:hypothetical protein